LRPRTFYQPSREDPISGSIPIEEGAGPYRNWNEKINADCYAPNAEIGNFRKMSFNLDQHSSNGVSICKTNFTRYYSRRDENAHHFGVGNGIAQPYHHTILPLATRRDKVTQVRWELTHFTEPLVTHLKECGYQRLLSIMKRWKCLLKTIFSTPF
jgi:hypothetical protein